MMPKTERFEMRVDEHLLERLDKWRGEQADVPSRAEAMRRLVEAGLGGSSEGAVRFSDGEKLLVIMMRDLFKHLGMKRGEVDTEFISEVIWGGHYWAPKWVMHGLFHDHEDDPNDLKFVVDVLDMWEFIERAYDDLSDEEKITVKTEGEPFGSDVKFRGFDGNNEAELLGIAGFLIEKMNRFGRFAGRDLNSHMRSIGRYRRMLEVFLPMRSNLIGQNLDAKQLITILTAQH